MNDPPSPARTWCGGAEPSATTRDLLLGRCQHHPDHEQQHRRPRSRHLRLERGVGGRRRQRQRDLLLERRHHHPDHGQQHRRRRAPTSPARTWCGRATTATTTEIYLWDGVTTTQITNNDTDDRWPAISGSNVVWMDETKDRTTTRSTRTASAVVSRRRLISYCDDGAERGCDGGSVRLPDGLRDLHDDHYRTTPVPSISFGGLALLAGLVLGSVAWARRGS